MILQQIIICPVRQKTKKTEINKIINVIIGPSIKNSIVYYYIFKNK